MKIVIDIKDDDYYDIIGDALIGEFTTREVINAVKNGTPLPKGHGRLIDEKDLSLMTVHMIDGMLVCDAPTIIEADTEKRGQGMTHELKILPRWFEDVCAQRKTFEIRKNDRDYNVGDTLILKEWYRGKYTGREVKRTVSYIYYGDGCYGLSDEYVVMAIRGARVVLDENLCKMDGNPVNIDKAIEHYEGTLEMLKGVGLEVNG